MKNQIICIMVMFSAVMLSCADSDRLKLKTKLNCKIEYYGDSIRINMQDNKYTLVYDNAKFVFKDARTLAMSNKEYGNTYSKNGSTCIRKISHGKYSSTIYTKTNIVVIYYNQNYVIDKICTNGYVQYGEVEVVPYTIKLDSALSSRMQSYVVR